MKSTWVDFQSPLAHAIKSFLAYKRALRRHYDTEEKALRLLDRYLVEQHITLISEISTDLLDDFLKSRPRTRPRSYNHLVGVVHRLFDWMVKRELIGVSPFHATPRRVTNSRVPYLFDISSAKLLLEFAQGLPDNSRAPLRGASYRMIFAILFGLGLRVGEVSRLRLKDLDFDRDLLVIRDTKFDKSRLVPFGPRMAETLQEYLVLREKCWGLGNPDTPVFSFTKGKPIHPGTISQTFHHLVPHLHLKVRQEESMPCVHDLRHSFAVGALLRWYRSGVNPTDRLLHLSAFLGHADPSSTAVYLTITSELLQEANKRFTSYAGSIFFGRVLL
jgi:site-specific recombinase XerD